MDKQATAADGIALLVDILETPFRVMFSWPVVGIMGIAALVAGMNRAPMFGEVGGTLPIAGAIMIVGAGVIRVVQGR
jgi:hypothetical protein